MEWVKKVYLLVGGGEGVPVKGKGVQTLSLPHWFFFSPGLPPSALSSWGHGRGLRSVLLKGNGVPTLPLPHWFFSPGLPSSALLWGGRV